MIPDPASIPNVVRVARAAAAADARRRFITISGYALAGAMGAAAAGVGLASLLTDAPWWWVVPAGAGAASVSVAGVFAWVRRWSIAHAAGEVDRANGTEGALRTAIEINDRDGEPSLVTLARSRGERLAASVDPRRGIAPPDHRGWWWSIPAIGACVAFGLLLDPIDRTPKRPDPSPMIARALDETQPGLEEARAVEPESLPDPEKWAETMAEIEALEEELRRGDAAEDAPTRAAAAMEQAADELDRQAELAASEEQAIRDRAEAYRTDEASEPSRLAQRLADALARNDMDAAEQAARELDRASESLTEEELRALADTLEDMASRLDDPSAMPQEPAGQQSDPTETAPSPTDPAGQPDQPQTPPSEQTPEVTPPPQQPQSRERQNPESLPEALRRQAESLREPPRNPEPQDPSQQDANQDQSQQQNEQPAEQPAEQPEPQPGQEYGEQTGERPSADPNQQQPESQPSQDPNQQGQPQPSQQGEPQQGQSPQEQPEPGQEQQGSQQQTQEQQGQQQQGQQQQGQQEQGQPQQGNEQGTQPQPGEQPSQQPTQQPGQPQPGEQPGDQPQPQPSGQPGDQPQQQPGQQPGQQPRQVPAPDPSGQPQGTPQPDPNAPPGSIERAVERLREQQDARQRNRQVAESLRDRARGLMDDPSLPPGDGGAGREDAPLAQDNPLTDDPARYEPVDASGQASQDPDSGRVVGEWFDPNREDLPPSERAAAAGEMRRAVRKARDAMDNQQVPRRYRDLVRRVFDRVERRAEEVAPGPAPQGQDAQP